MQQVPLKSDESKKLYRFNLLLLEIMMVKVYVFCL